MDWKYFVDNFQFVNLIWAFILPVALEIVDFATGFINACIKGERSSSKMRQGGGKKFGEAVCLLVAQLFTWAMQLPSAFVYLVSMYISFMELISIIENVKKLGVPAPKQVDDVMDKLKGELFEEQKDETERGE